MGITELAALVRAGLDRLERLARDAEDEPWRYEAGHDGPGIRVGEADGWWRMGEFTSAAYSCLAPLDDCDSVRAMYRAEAQLIIQRADPATVLRDVAARRRLLDQALGWEHGLVRWDHNEVRACKVVIGKPCDCGRDERVHAVLQALAAPYQETNRG